MPRVSSAALCMAALIVLSACGGGGESMLGSGPMQGPVETRDRDAAIRRAQDAAREAAASAVAASANCDAVPAACESAQAAADSAELAKAAADEAEISTTFDVAFRAAAAAELAASNASTSAAEAARIATQISGGGGSDGTPVSGGLADWLFPGTVESAHARNEAIRAVERAHAARAFAYGEGGYGVDYRGENSPGESGLIDNEGRYYASPDSFDRWGIWDHPSMSVGISKFQRVNELHGFDNAVRIQKNLITYQAHPVIQSGPYSAK